MELANVCLNKLFASLSEDSVSKLWRAKGAKNCPYIKSVSFTKICQAASYSTSHAQSSFLSYFASTTPDSEHKRVRLKTALFLQGSALLDLAAIRARLAPHEKILQLEVAIIEGKVCHFEPSTHHIVFEHQNGISSGITVQRYPSW